MSLKLRQLFRQYSPQNVLSQSALKEPFWSGRKRCQQSLISRFPRETVISNQIQHVRHYDSSSTASVRALDSTAHSENLPLTLSSCPGCGALAQTVEPGAAGFYNVKRTAVASVSQNEPAKGRNTNSKTEDQVFTDALANAPEELRESIQSRNIALSGASTDIIIDHSTLILYQTQIQPL